MLLYVCCGLHIVIQNKMEFKVQTNEINYIPIRIRRTVEDKFFEEYREENIQSKQSISCSNDAEIETCESFQCNIPGCSTNLTSQDSYNNHYNLNHKHVCCECHRIYPSAHLLDIHISEWHDSYFQIKSEKENSYRCLVETCQEVFTTSKARHKHLLKAHNFPSSFHFEKPPPNPQKNAKKSDNKMDVEVTECEKGPPNEMEIDVPTTSKPNPRVPTTICFGKGANRAFHRQRKKK